MKNLNSNRLDISELFISSEVAIELDIKRSDEDKSYITLIDVEGLEIKSSSSKLEIIDPEKKEREDARKSDVLDAVKEIIDHPITVQNVLKTLSSVKSNLDNSDHKTAKIECHVVSGSPFKLKANKVVMSVADVDLQYSLKINDLNLSTENSGYSGHIETNKIKIQSESFSVNGSLAISTNSSKFKLKRKKDHVFSTILDCNDNKLSIDSKLLDNSGNKLEIDANKASGYIK